MGLGWASPDPGCSMTIQVLGGDPGDIGNVVVIGQGLPGKGVAPEDAPPALNQIQPSRSHRDEGMLDPGMSIQPLPDRTTGVAGEVVGNQREISVRVGPVQRLEQIEIAAGITREPFGSGLARPGPAGPHRPRLSAVPGRNSRVL
jgi:hypothetical protein